MSGFVFAPSQDPTPGPAPAGPTVLDAGCPAGHPRCAVRRAAALDWHRRHSLRPPRSCVLHQLDFRVGALSRFPVDPAVLFCFLRAACSAGAGPIACCAESWNGIIASQTWPNGRDRARKRDAEPGMPSSDPPTRTRGSRRSVARRKACRCWVAYPLRVPWGGVDEGILIQQ